MRHIVRAADGRGVELNLTRGLAIKVHCTECMGYEESPAECTSANCALYPYRGKTRRTSHGDLELKKKMETPRRIIRRDAPVSQ